MFINNRSVFEFQRDFREFGSDIVRKFLSNTLNFYNISHTNPFEKLINLAKEQRIYTVEPFGYYLAYKLWKFAKMIKSTLEFTNNNEREEHKKEFHKIIKRYINNTLTNIENFYDQKIDNLKDL